MLPAFRNQPILRVKTPENSPPRAHHPSVRPLRGLPRGKVFSGLDDDVEGAANDLVQKNSDSSQRPLPPIREKDLRNSRRRLAAAGNFFTEAVEP